MSIVSLNEACDRVDYGLTTSAVVGDRGPRFLRITDIDGDFVDWKRVPRCAATPDEEIKYALATGDVVVARTGASTGRSQWVVVSEPSVFASYLVRFRPSANFDSRFVSYVLQTAEWREHVSSVAHGKSAQPNMSASEMARFEFEAPPIGEQRAIAEVLGALDDKIAANTKLATTAVTLADTLFVQQASGRSFAPLTFGDVANVLGGGTPNTKIEEYWGDTHCWATPTDVTGLASPYLEQTSRMITDAGLQACSSVLHPTGSILMTSRATIGAFAIAEVPTAVNQGFIVVNARDPQLQWWLFHEMRSRVSEFLSYANGATFLELSRGRFKQLPVRLISEEKLGRFNDQVSVLHGRARAAATESAQLAQARDVLLPLLMSGKLRVKDAERVVEEAI